jgi:hypothetical protein
LTVVDGQGKDATTRGVACGIPPLVEKTVSLYVVGQWGGDNMAVGGAAFANAAASMQQRSSTLSAKFARANGLGDVVGGAWASCAMLSRAILARMVPKGAACRAHSAQMLRIAASMGSGGIIGTIKRLSSAQRCFAVASSWRCLSLANTGLGNAKSVNTPAHSAANSDSANAAARSTHSWQRCSVVKAFSRAAVSWGHHLLACWPMLSPTWLPCDNVAHWPRWPMLLPGNVAWWPFWPTLSPVRLSHGDVTCQLHWQTLSPVRLPLGNIACWPCWPMLLPMWPPRGDVVCWQETLLQTLQPAPLTPGSIVSWPVPFLPMPQRV